MNSLMSRIVGSKAEEIAKSALWSAGIRIGVPIILALILSGIPAHLVWALRINDELLIARRDIAAVQEVVKALQVTDKDARRTESQVQSDLATVKTNVTAILRAMDRVEKQFDVLSSRRAP